MLTRAFTLLVCFLALNACFAGHSLLGESGSTTGSAGGTSIGPAASTDCNAPAQTSLPSPISPHSLAPGARLVRFMNNCNDTVWLGFVGGSAASTTGKPCVDDNDCPWGAQCAQAGATTLCFWKNPAPFDGNFGLAPGASHDVVVPYCSQNTVVWSGAISGRTGCETGSCDIGECGNDGHGGCKPGQGFAQPATEAEITMSSTGTDYYDVGVINGVSLAMSIAPMLTSNITAQQGNTAPYTCGAPGSPNAAFGLGGCSWNFTPPSNDYIWVSAGGAACTGTSDCTLPAVCGLSFNPGQAQAFQKTCGTQYGYWSADEVCGIAPSQGAPFNCAQSAGSAVTLTNLYACVGVGSCYQSTATNACCGCVNWDQAGLQVPPAPYTEACVSSNPNWTTYVQPTLAWLKAACPTAYTYPYDDKSSTFTCADTNSGLNVVNYVVTYCPR